MATTPAGTGPADGVAAEAQGRMKAGGVLASGHAGPDARRLLPATEQAGVLGVSKPATSGPGAVAAAVKRLAGADVAGLYRELPEGIPLVTYRLCAETASTPVSCSGPQPLVKPVVADVTGDGTPDLAASLVPSADTAQVVAGANLLASAQRKLDGLLGRSGNGGKPADAEKTVGGLIGSSGSSRGPDDPAVKDAEARRDRQRDDLTSRLAAKLGLVSQRLPGGDAGPLKAQVWAEYDIPHDRSPRRLSLGFDGFRRGASLSGTDWGVYDFRMSGGAGAGRPGAAVADVRVDLRRTRPGASIATVAAIADLVGGRSGDPRLVSLLQSPVPEKLTVTARLDGADTLTGGRAAGGAGGGTGARSGGQGDGAASSGAGGGASGSAGVVQVTGSAPSALDAVVVGRDVKAREDHFTQVVVSRVTSRLTAELSRPSPGGAADLHVTSSAPIGRAEVHHYVYRDGALGRVLGGSLAGAPADFRVRYDAVGGGALTVETAPRAASARLVYFDRAASRTVLRATLTDLPAQTRIHYDLAGNRLTYTGSAGSAAGSGSTGPGRPAGSGGAKIGGLDVLLQRDGGAVASPPGEHVTLIKDGGRLGVSARVSGLTGLDFTGGAKPHGVVELASGGRPFLAAADVDRTHLLRLEVSNTPRRVEVELDPAAKKARYRASGVIGTLRAAYANTRTGPTIDSTLRDVRSGVTAAWQVGDRSSAEVTTASGLKRAELYAARAYVTRIGPDGGEDVHAVVRGIHRHVAVVADLPAGRLDWNADEPVASVDAFARASFQGRPFRVAARAEDVPERFEAGWGGGAYRFQGVSGPIGSATIAVTNHDGARAPDGPHLAAHYDQASGDLDASVRLDGLTGVELGGTGAGFKVGLRAARQSVALDADVTPAGDVRFGALGRLGPIPGDIEVSAAGGGPVTYSSSGAGVDLEGEVWLGKAAAVAGIAGVPGVASGLALVDGGCAPGSPGCAADQGPFCAGAGTGSPAGKPPTTSPGVAAQASPGTPTGAAAGGRGCFGVRGYVALGGLPSEVTVDLARRTFTFSGYRPKVRKLDLYLDSRVLAPVPVRARATLDGLPSAITGMSFGPFEVGAGKDADGRAADVVKVNYRVEPAATITSLTALAEADLGERYGVVRGRAVVDPVPAVVSINGTYGKKTHVRVQNSSAVKRLTAEVTVVPPGARPGTGVSAGEGASAGEKPGTGVVRFTDVPAAFTIDADAAAETGLRVPGFAYRADGGANTLDGLVAVEGALVGRVYRPRAGALLDASFRFKDLASTTTARVNPDMSVELASAPVPTKLLEVHAGLYVAPVQRQRVAVRKDIPYTTGFFAFQLDGDFALGQSRIDDVSLGVHGVKWLKIRPGKVPFGMRAPAELGYISPGFEGAYDHLDIGTGGVDLRPKVALDVRITRNVGGDVFKDSLRLGRATSLELRRYDQRSRPISARQQLKIAGASIACLTIDARPGLAAARRAGSLTLRGADGPQMVNLLDSGGQVQGYALDLMSQFMSPFEGAGWKVAGVSAGRCR
ncbi:hypothetical protein DQ384_08945 [Sphaerisporangium album]|uniref:Uncharacterized protein n=1 Tax=Sphaerisporangium album TaxID=509200 RepID=A0A367FN32_9ACTN|nr:hypothetical protein DQ384_08945 [Sphaerisporangium album]